MNNYLWLVDTGTANIPVIAFVLVLTFPFYYEPFQNPFLAPMILPTLLVGDFIP